uniref:zinc finger protein 507 n=1 Tax=Doryrhamphus excisus TaxID=161450 RepID=UPI0025ADF8EF|nr:zinc finger protein 507 [Doryrhamphus excisus]XP_057932743.1 zinc finger protein 507 [Doryrhamphus excisus]XP_057932744.1 zinc finger protein 507 [Doryrhamphus excisus]
MEDVNNVAVLITTTASSSSSPPSHIQRAAEEQEADPPQRFPHKPAANSLIQVIEKLSKIVEKRPQQRRCTLTGQKVQHRGCEGERDSVGEEGGRGSPYKKVRMDVEADEGLDGDLNNNDDVNATGVEEEQKHTCYQCSLCPYMSATLALLKEHLKQHNKQNQDLILMCSECRFSSRDQVQLEEHVRMHLDSTHGKDSPAWDPLGEDGGLVGSEGNASSPEQQQQQQKKKWYSYEEYGLYRCLICSYVCSQQRMLKTHAWKHAGLLDCSYPVFEEEEEPPAKRESAAVNNTASQKQVVLLSPAAQDKILQKLPTAFKLQLCVPLPAGSKQDLVSPPGAAKGEREHYPVKDVTGGEPMMEVHVTTETEEELSSVADSLLSSAQKIINNDPNSVGHMNVIVERLPSAEDSVMAANPLLLGPDVEDQCTLDVPAEEREKEGHNGEEELGADITPSLVRSNCSPPDENVPPAGRKRTHSESLRLHSLAAEVLIAMPMRTAMPARTAVSTSQKAVAASTDGPEPSEEETPATLLDTDLHCKVKEAGRGDGEEEGPAAKAGISSSLLTVIERLRERSDQNASDEDILKELQDNAQFHAGAVLTANGAQSFVCSVPDALAAPADGGLVDYMPGSERPYRCRLCRYSSGNKGYIKQHLRVHRQRQPYQCPICEHIASDSKDLESHMIHHCKTRMYRCQQCQDAFHYKSQLRSHEREHHSVVCDTSALTAVVEAAGVVEDCEQEVDEECASQKTFKCDVCDYTSATYVGVRNHRRIHNSDKPYRCCSCDFATTNMNNLKSHMRRHPQEQQAVQLLEQYRCSLCGYVCSHPPSLKSHMWKHAGDQNYNYEQVNKAINEAISQSSRAPVKVSSQADANQADANQADAHQADPQNLQRKVEVQSRPGMEYCVLLFCCCICGFESTSKERLLEHMKEHEGDLISIILSKEQQAPPPP